jgi:hypothetical protein
MSQFDPENNKSILEIQAERAFLAKQNDDHRQADKNIAFKPMQPTASISTLRQKLQDKIDSFRKHRHAPETDRAASPVSDELSEVQLELGAERSDNGDDNETLASRDEMLEARRKRRGEVRDNRRRKRKEERRADKDGAKKDSKSNGKSVNSDASKPDFTAKSGKVCYVFLTDSMEGSSTCQTECVVGECSSSDPTEPKSGVPSGIQPLVSHTILALCFPL